MFAKLYETNIGQILVKMDASEEQKPEIRFFFEPEGLGVCSTAMGFPDTEEGWDNQLILFNSVDEDQAIAIANGVIEQLGL